MISNEMIAPIQSNTKEILPNATKLIIIKLIKDEETEMKIAWKEARESDEPHAMGKYTVKVKGLIPNIKFFSCDKCIFYTDHKEHLNYHKIELHKMKMCKICKKVLSKNNFYTHIKRVHGNKKPHVCNLCPFATNERRSLHFHINAIHLKYKPYRCKQCKFSSAYKKDVDRHTREIHLRLEVYKCTACKLTTNCKRYLKMHFDRKHLQLKPYKCTFASCSFSTVSKWYLDQHLRCKKHTKSRAIVHNKTKKHSVNFCSIATNEERSLQKRINKYNFSSVTKNDVDRHMKEVHVKSQVHKCTTCAFSTRCKRYFAQHLRSKKHLELTKFKRFSR